LHRGQKGLGFILKKAVNQLCTARNEMKIRKKCRELIKGEREKVKKKRLFFM
jgi:hypothetical protein